MKLATRNLVLLGLLAGCLTPTDRSGELRVEMDAVPTLFLKDTVRLTARVVDQAGQPVENAEIQFSSDDQTVVSVDTAGVLLALGVGTANVTATALGFADAPPATLPARVRGLLEVDSVVPKTVRFGERIQVFGVGLNPEPVLFASLSDVEAPIAEYTPDDPEKPDRLGVLDIWVPPPAPKSAALVLLSGLGGLAIPDSIRIIQRDFYEPNDTVPSDLGEIPLGFFNPALAFETRGRTDVAQPADWYTFTNTTTQDRTIIMRAKDLAVAPFQVFVTDSLFWNSTLQDYGIGSTSWSIGPGTNFCSGMGFVRAGEAISFAQLPFPIALVALKDLPPGTYHLIAPYVVGGTPLAYELLIASDYISVVPPDPFEENDYCDVASPIPQNLLSGNTRNLTIDNPQDVDWFKFTVGAAGLSFSASVLADNAEADIDLYLIGDFRPDSLPVLAIGSTPGTADAVAQFLPAGNYFLVAVDFAGQATRYTLTIGSGGTAGGAPRAGNGTDGMNEYRARMEQVRKHRARGLTDLLPAPERGRGRGRGR